MSGPTVAGVMTNAGYISMPADVAAILAPEPAPAWDPDARIPRTCHEFGHPLPGLFAPWDDSPACAGCAAIVATLRTERVDGREAHVFDACGRIGAVIVSRLAGVAPFCAMTCNEADGPLVPIGRRDTRAAAMAAIAASHDCGPA